MSGGKRFARAPRRGVPSSPSARLELLDRLDADPRYRALPANYARCISVAVRKHADARGRWFTKAQTWADDVGVSKATVWRAVAAACATEPPLLKTEPYLRPDGRQGATSFFLDSALVSPPGNEPSELSRPADLGHKALQACDGDKVSQGCHTRTVSPNEKALNEGEGGPQTVVRDQLERSAVSAEQGKDPLPECSEEGDELSGAVWVELGTLKLGELLRRHEAGEL